MVKQILGLMICCVFGFAHAQADKAACERMGNPNNPNAAEDMLKCSGISASDIEKAKNSLTPEQRKAMAPPPPPRALTEQEIREQVEKNLRGPSDDVTCEQPQFAGKCGPNMCYVDPAIAKAGAPMCVSCVRKNGRCFTDMFNQYDESKLKVAREKRRAECIEKERRGEISSFLAILCKR